MSNDEIIPGFDEETSPGNASHGYSLAIRLEKIKTGDCLILYLSGCISTYNSRWFYKQVTKAISYGFTNLLFQCSTLDSVSPSGIGVFAAFLKTVKEEGGDLAFLGIRPGVYEQFRELGLGPVFRYTESLDEALNFFRSVFPLHINCPHCAKELEAPRPGRFRCTGCHSVFSVDRYGLVFLG
jgi:anti-anti-sigma factor